MTRFRREGRTSRAVVAAAVSLALVPVADAQLYKWTDEKGVVHYTGKAPDPGRAGTVLDTQGRPVSRIEGAATPEQARAREAEEERRRAAAREEEAEARRNRAILSSYTTEAEIDLARARAAATVQSQLESAQAYVAQLGKRKQDIDARKARLGDKPIPPQLEADSAAIDAEVAKNRDLVAQKQRELAAVNARYDADKRRWRELKAQDASGPQASRGGGSGGATAKK